MLILDATAKSGGEGDGEVDHEKMQHTHEIFDAATKSGGEGDGEVGKIVRQNCYPYCSKLFLRYKDNYKFIFCFFFNRK